MLIWPTSLLLQESHGITTPLCGYKSHLARSAQMVNGKEDLVPRELGAAACQVFEVAGMGPMHNVDHLIFRGRLLCHVPPFGERNALLKKQSCIVGATGWCRWIGEEKFSRTGRYRLADITERAALSGRLRTLGSVISQETVAKYLTEDEGELCDRCENEAGGLLQQAARGP